MKSHAIQLAEEAMSDPTVKAMIENAKHMGEMAVLRSDSEAIDQAMKRRASAAKKIKDVAILACEITLKYGLPIGAISSRCRSKSYTNARREFIKGALAMGISTKKFPKSSTAKKTKYVNLLR